VSKDLVPSIIIDSFFKNPDKIVEFANTLKYENSTFNYPGEKSVNINDVNPELANFVLKKILSFMGVDDFECNYDMRFQKIESGYGEGLIHTDQCELTSIIYLDKFGSIDSGTNLYTGKQNEEYYNSHEFTKNSKEGDKRKYLYRNKLYNEHKQYAQKFNSPYKKTVEVKSLYNRAFIFPGLHIHAASNFLNDERLTLTCFFWDIKPHRPPPWAKYVGAEENLL
jgi:hypothetical protein